MFKKFDNIIRALVTLLVTSTLEGWPDYLLTTVDGAKSDTGPIYNNNLEWVPFLFVAFISVGSFFCINLFIAIVSMKFNEALERNKNKYLNKD